MTSDQAMQLLTYTAQLIEAAKLLAFLLAAVVGALVLGDS